jgi:hypothetical protein
MSPGQLTMSVTAMRALELNYLAATDAHQVLVLPRLSFIEIVVAGQVQLAYQMQVLQQV